MKARSGGVALPTLDLGQDGGTGSLTNAGAVDIEGQGDLAISGNYTVTGSGAIALKGAGAEITSDGHRTGDVHQRKHHRCVGFSGQIGDAGIFGSNDLTFDNYGSVVASGSGVTLTLNTGGNMIGDDGGTLEAENGATW